MIEGITLDEHGEMAVGVRKWCVNFFNDTYPPPPIVADNFKTSMPTRSFYDYECNVLYIDLRHIKDTETLILSVIHGYLWHRMMMWSSKRKLTEEEKHELLFKASSLFAKNSYKIYSFLLNT